mmetsp:Transcript_101528/g.254555  ORF Transcript_101528/g.254555 Transcript_101528/m.254555 type:complete len:235 (+) Transcript_101528:665-1369(+)
MIRSPSTSSKDSISSPTFWSLPYCTCADGNKLALRPLTKTRVTSVISRTPSSCVCTCAIVPATSSSSAAGSSAQASAILSQASSVAEMSRNQPLCTPSSKAGPGPLKPATVKGDTKNDVSAAKAEISSPTLTPFLNLTFAIFCSAAHRAKDGSISFSLSSPSSPLGCNACQTPDSLKSSSSISTFIKPPLHCSTTVPRICSQSYSGPNVWKSTRAPTPVALLIPALMRKAAQES